MIQQVFFREAGPRLYGALRIPPAPVRGGVLLCPPLLEERKGAMRVYAELGALLEERSHASLRFDYAGTGDSEGPQEIVSQESCLSDIEAAAVELARHVNAPILALGLRLGASLAALAVARSDQFSGLMLWQPIVSGEEFHRTRMRRSTFRHSLIGADSVSRGSEPGLVDLDGFAVTETFCCDVRSINLFDLPPPRSKAAIVQISHTERIIPTYTALSQGWKADLWPIVCESFWNRIGYVDCASLLSGAANWIAEHASMQHR